MAKEEGDAGPPTLLAWSQPLRGREGAARRRAWAERPDGGGPPAQIPQVIIGENQTFQGPEEYVRSRGVKLEILDDRECVQLMREFIQARPALWDEDIGEPSE